MGQRRRFGQITRKALDIAALNFLQQRDQAINVHSLRQTILNRLVDERMVRDLAFDVPGPGPAVWREARESRGESPSISRQPAPAAPSRTPSGAKVGRNEPCPCGAKNPDGAPKKYKKCHGR